MHHGDHPQGLFIRRVSDQVIPKADEPQGSVRQVRPAVTGVGKRNQIFNGAVNLVNDAMGRFRAVLSNVDRDFINVGEGFRMKLVTEAVHARLRLASMRACSRAKASAPGISFTLPLLMSS